MFETKSEKDTEHAACNERLCEIAATYAFLIYVIGELLFRHSTLCVTYPLLSQLSIVTILESISAALAIAVIATRLHTFNIWQATSALIGFGLLFLSCILMDDYWLIQCYILLIAVSQTDIKKLCCAYSIAVTVVVVTVMLLSLAGLLYCKDVIPNSRLVFSYGFQHPNTPGVFLFSALAAMSYVNSDKRIWWIPGILAIVSSVFSYVVLSSHASAVILALLAISVFLAHALQARGFRTASPQPCFLILIAAPFILGCTMAVCAAFYDPTNSLLSWFNNVTHYRPYYAHQYFETSGGFTLFGQAFEGSETYHTGLSFASLDSGYCWLTMVIGVVPSCALFVMYAIGAYRLSRGGCRFLVFFQIIIICLYLTVETMPLYIQANITALILAVAFAPSVTIRQSYPDAPSSECSLSRGRRARGNAGNTTNNVMTQG